MTGNNGPSHATAAVDDKNDVQCRLGVGGGHGCSATLLNGMTKHLIHGDRRKMQSVDMVIADAIGLTGLVARGYGTITWGFIVVLFIPLLTWGVFLIWRADKREAANT